MGLMRQCTSARYHVTTKNRVKTSNFGRTCKIGHFSTSPDITPCSRPPPIDQVLFQANCTDKISSYPLPDSENGIRHIIIDQLDSHSSVVTSNSAQFREHMDLLLVTTIFNSIFYSYILTHNEIFLIPCIFES